MPSDNNYIGSWDIDGLEKTASHDTWAGDDSDLQAPLRFIREVHKVVRKRLEHLDSLNDPQDLSVFLLDPNPNAKNLKKSTSEPMIDGGDKQLAGYAWFVSTAVVSGHKMILPSGEDGEVFSWITNELDCGDVPAIIVNPRAEPTQLRFYPNGVANPDERDVWDMTKKRITPASVEVILNELHDGCLVTPTAQSEASRLWGGKYPIRQAEKTIQGVLKPGLKAAFLDCAVKEEQTGTAGRYDLTIIERGPAPINHGLLELKVLKSHSYTGETEYDDKHNHDKVSEGVDQAYTYREKEHFRWSAFCCYDMRTEDTGQTCFDHVAGEAKVKDVTLWRWYLYSSSKEYRKAFGKKATN